jgi:hypothetical protein
MVPPSLYSRQKGMYFPMIPGRISKGWYHRQQPAETLSKERLNGTGGRWREGNGFIDRVLV